MKLNKMVLGISLALGIASFANAATITSFKDQGHGSVKFSGSIVDAPCSIDADTIDQSVAMGAVSNVELSADNNTGTSPERNFEIRLQKCNIAEAGKSVTATFTGAPGATDGNLGLSGSAKGASIVMVDGSGKQLKLGDKSTARKLTNGSNTLTFTAYLQGDGSSAGITPGNFTSTANFTLDYK